MIFRASWLFCVALLLAVCTAFSAYATSPSLVISPTQLVPQPITPQPLMLTEAWARAQTSPQALAAHENWQASRAESRGSIGGFLPDISAGTSWSARQTKTNGALSQTNHPTSADITLVQPLTLGDAWSNWRRSAAIAQSQRAESRAVLQETLLATTVAYADVLAAHERISATTALVAAMKNNLKAAKLRLKVGEGTRTDVAQAEARLAAADADRIAAEGQHQAARHALARWIGPLDENDTLAWPTLQVPTTPPTTQPPMVAAAEARARAARHQSTQAWWEFAPTANLQATTRHDDGSTSGGITPRNTTTQEVQINVRLPLFSGGENVAGMQAARARARAAGYTLEDTRRDWQRMLATAQTEVESATAAATAAQKEVEAQQRAAEGVRLEWKLGTRSSLELLDAEQELASARAKLANAKRNRTVATANLLAAQGVLGESNQ